jgi:murein DD-endopeptidase MepM/ murein hydrolase activator NlpD
MCLAIAPCENNAIALGYARSLLYPYSYERLDLLKYRIKKMPLEIPLTMCHLSFLKFFLFSALLCTCVYAYDVHNGATALIELDKTHTRSLRKNGVSLPLLSHPTKPDAYISFIAIPYTQTSPIELLHVSKDANRTVVLNILKGDYPKEVLHVEPSKVSPPKEVMGRIKRERDEAMAIYNTSTPKRFWKMPFELPLESVITSAYGSARLFNDTLKSYHSGTDFRAPIGTPVRASNDGVVVLAKERYYAGGSLVLDHGEGIYSVYYHLSTLHVRKGEPVKKGDEIGLSGASGRVSGPHVHFGFMVGGIPVDPLDFIAKVKAIY